MNYGKIVAVHGRNISLSIQITEENGKVVDGNEQTRRHIEITLPAYNLRDVDYAVYRAGDAARFEALSGKVWFPDAYPAPAEGKLTCPGNEGEFSVFYPPDVDPSKVQ